MLAPRNRKRDKAQQELIGLVEDFAYDDKSEDESLMSSGEYVTEERADIEAEETVCVFVVYSFIETWRTTTIDSTVSRSDISIFPCHS